MRLRKGLYGLKQAGRGWYLEMSRVFLKELGFTRSAIDHSVFYRREGDDDTQRIFLHPYTPLKAHIFVSDTYPYELHHIPSDTSSPPSSLSFNVLLSDTTVQLAPALPSRRHVYKRLSFRHPTSFVPRRYHSQTRPTLSCPLSSSSYTLHRPSTFLNESRSPQIGILKAIVRSSVSQYLIRRSATASLVLPLSCLRPRLSAPFLLAYVSSISYFSAAFYFIFLLHFYVYLFLFFLRRSDNLPFYDTMSGYRRTITDSL